MQELLAEPSDPAIVKATLAEVFEASQDVMDQMGRAAALQHHARRYHLMRDVGLTHTVAEAQLSRLPLTLKWLLRESVSKVTGRSKHRSLQRVPLHQLPRRAGPTSPRSTSAGTRDPIPNHQTMITRGVTRV